MLEGDIAKRCARVFREVAKKYRAEIMAMEIMPDDPLRSLQLMMSYIEGTTTKTGLQVKAFVNGRQYVKGKTVPDELFKTIPLSRHSELPAWNYTLRPN